MTPDKLAQGILCNHKIPDTLYLFARQFMSSLFNKHQAFGHLGYGADGVKASCAVGGAPGSGRGMTITPVTGLGAYMPENLETIMQTYKQQIKADRIAAALERKTL